MIFFMSYVIIYHCTLIIEKDVRLVEMAGKIDEKNNGSFYVNGNGVQYRMWNS